MQLMNKLKNIKMLIIQTRNWAICRLGNHRLRKMHKDHTPPLSALHMILKILTKTLMTLKAVLTANTLKFHER